MTKVAVIKLGSRVSVSSVGTSGGTGETLSIIKMLVNGGADVTVYTKVLDSDAKPNDFKILDIRDNYKDINSQGFDSLVVLNGNVNYFGGVDDPAQTLNYNIINNFKGKVFYIMCDCNLFLKQLWSSIEGKSWRDNYKKEDIEITRDDIVYITQARDTRQVLEKARKYVNIKNVIYYPFEKFPMLTLKYLDINDNPTYDLLYGGTFRNGRREDDMITFYFGYPDKYNVEMFGNINLDNFKSDKVRGLNSPKFGEPVTYDTFSDKMREAIATVIIGDKIYKKLDDLAQRIYESIMIGNVVLIDASYDFSKRVFKNSELIRFNYVRNRKDVEDRLDRLKDLDFRKHIIELQREDTKINLDDYCINFMKLVGGLN